MMAQTQQDVADALGVNKNAVTEWKTEGCPHLKKPPFDVQKIEAWRQETKRCVTNKRTKVVLDVISRTKAATARIKEATAIALEYQNAVDSGELISPDDAKATTEKQADVFRKELLALPHQAERMVGLSLNQAKEMLETISREMLTRLYKGDK